MDDASAGFASGDSRVADERRVIAVVLPLLAIALAILVVLGFRRYIDPDEIEALRAGWKLLQGRMIYRDFFEHHHPLWYITLSPVIAIMPERASTLIWFRGFNLALVGANLAMTFMIGRRLFNAAAALIGLVLFATTHLATYKMIELRPDNLQTLFGLVGVYLLIRCFDRPRALTALASGIAFGLSFAVLQKAVFLLLPVALIVGVRLLQRRVRFREMALVAVGFVVSLVPFVVWLAATGTLRIFWQLNYRLNADQAYLASPMTTMRATPQVYQVLADSFVASTLLWGFAAAGMLVALWPQPGADMERVRLRREISLMAVVLVLWVVVLSKYYWQYYLPAFPFLAVLAGGAMMKTLRHHRAALACLLLLACFGSYRYAEEAFAGAKSNVWQVSAFKQALSITRPGDLVIDTRQNYNLFRPDPLYTGFVHPDGLVPLALKHVTGRTESILDVIAATHPVLVNMEALPKDAWPADPRLAGYHVLPSAPGFAGVPGIGNVLMRDDHAVASGVPR